MKSPGAEFTLDDLSGMIQTPSREALAIALGDFVKLGKLRLIVRVYSRRIPGAGIKDFGSIKDVPNSIHDWHSDTSFEVTGDDIGIIYKVA